jgi:pterin-4a-carbinolamine dehydratase
MVLECLFRQSHVQTVVQITLFNPIQNFLNRLGTSAETLLHHTPLMVRMTALAILLSKIAEQHPPQAHHDINAMPHSR